MLSLLFGSQNVEKILYFLLINEKCYGMQLHRFLNTPLTPVQKGLARLEKAGVIISKVEGKTRFYRFNPVYALKAEMEKLLRKSYELLPIQDKKKYYAGEDRESHLSLKGSQDTLLACWNRLKEVKMLLIHAKLNASHRSKRGRGEVKVVEEGPSMLCFHEAGVWEGENGREEIHFSNTLRFRLDVASETIALEHLRLGAAKPIFLVFLKPKRVSILESVDSHLCGPDTYFGQIQIEPHFLQLSWRIVGPKKNDRIECLYT